MPEIKENTIVIPQEEEILDTVYSNPLFTETNPCTLTAMANLRSSSSTSALKLDTLEVLVLPADTTEKLVEADVPATLAHGKVDTLVFTIDNTIPTGQ